MSDLGDRAATLSLGVTSNQALEELTRLGQGLKDFKSALTEFSRTQIPDPFAGLSQQAKTSVIDIIETLKKGGALAEAEASAVGGKASISFSQAFANGVRGSIKLTGDAAKEHLAVLEASLKEAQSKGVQLKSEEVAAAKAAADAQKQIEAGQVQDAYIYRQKGAEQWKKIKADEVAAAKAAADAERQTVATQVQDAYIYQQKGAEQWKKIKADEVAAAKAAADAERQLILNNNFNTASPGSQFSTASKAAGLIGAGEEALALEKYGAAAVTASGDLDKLKAAAEAARGATNKHRIEYELFGKELRLTSTASRELLAVLHELSTGRFTQAPGSFMSFLLYSGVEGTAILSVVGALVGLAATVGVVAVAFAKGKVEMDEMNRAMSSTNDYSAVTRGSMDELAQSVANSSRLTIGAAKESVTQLVASGKVGASAIGLVAASIGNYAVVSGKTAEQATSDLVKIFSDPTKGANELNASMHFLSAAELLHIRNLQEQGDLTGAQAVLAEKLRVQLDSTEVRLGTMQKAWDGVKHAASDAWDAMLSIGREDTTNELLDKASTAAFEARNILLVKLKNQKAGFNVSGIEEAQAANDAAWAAYKKLLADKKKEDADAAAKGVEAEKNQQNAFALSTAESKSYTDQLTKLTNQRTLVSGKLSTDTPELKALHESSLAALDKEIFALKGGNALIDSRLKLREGDLAAQIKQIEADGQLGRLGEAQVLQEKLKLELLQNQAKIEAERAKPAATPTEAITRQGNIAALMQQRHTLVQDEINAEDLLHENQLHDQWKAEGEALTKKGALVAGYWKKWHADNDKTLAKLAADNAVDAYNALVAAGTAGAEATLFEAEKNKAEALFRELQDKLAEIAGEEATHGGLVGMLNAGLASQQIKAELIPQIDAVLSKMKDAAGDNDGFKKLTYRLEAQVTKVGAELPPTFKKIADSIEQSLTDALDKSLRQKGKSFAEDLAAAIKKTLENLAINLVVHALVDPVMGGIRGAMGAVASGGSGGAVGSIGSIAQGFSSGFSNGLGGASSLVSGFGNLIGSSSISAFGTGMGLSSAAASEAAAAYTTASTALAAAGDATAAAEMASTASSLSIGSAIGAALPWVAGALAIYSMFGGGKKEDPHNNADSKTLAVQLGMGGVSSPYSNGWGPSWVVSGQTSGRGRWAEHPGLDQGTIDGLNKATDAIFTSGKKLADILGVDASVLDHVSVGSETFKDAADALGQLSDKVAQAILPNIASFQQSGETLAQTIARIVGDIQGFDAIVKHLGMTVNLTGTAVERAQTVENIISAGGGSQTFAANLQAFYQGFYSDTERLVNAQADLTKQFAALGLAVPATKAQFRQLVTGLDLTTSTGQALFGQLIALAPAFAQVADAASGLMGSIAQVQKDAASAVNDQISTSNSAASAAHRAADAYRQLTSTLTDAMTQLQIGDLSPLLGGQKLAAADDKLYQVFAQAMGGDTAALGDLPKAAQDFLTASRAFNASSDAYTSDFNRVMAMLANAKSMTGVNASIQDTVANNADNQVTLLMQIKAELAQATLDPAVLAQQTSELAAMGGSATQSVSLLQQLVDLMSQQNAETAASAAIAKAQQSAITYNAARSVADNALTAYQNFAATAPGLTANADWTQQQDYSTGKAFTWGGSYSNIPQSELDQLNSLRESYQKAFSAAFSALPGHATGLDYVPYDDYVMRAHKGEAVLTSHDADKWRGGESGITHEDFVALTERVDRLIAAVESGTRESVSATNNLAATHRDVAYQAEVHQVTRR